MLERVPPQNIEAEQGFLCALMINPKAFEIVEGELIVSDFYREDHRLIFKAAVCLNEKREPIDMITVIGKLRDEGNLEKEFNSLEEFNIWDSFSLT